MSQFLPIFKASMAPLRASLVIYVVETPNVRAASVLETKSASLEVGFDIYRFTPSFSTDYSTQPLQFGCDDAII